MVILKTTSQLYSTYPSSMMFIEKGRDNIFGFKIHSLIHESATTTHNNKYIQTSWKKQGQSNNIDQVTCHISFAELMHGKLQVVYLRQTNRRHSCYRMFIPYPLLKNLQQNWSYPHSKNYVCWLVGIWSPFTSFNTYWWAHLYELCRHFL